MVKKNDGLRKRILHAYTIPLDIMRGHKTASHWQVLPDWNWVNNTYEVKLPFDLSAIESISIDNTGRLADTDKSNQTYVPKPTIEPAGE